MPWQPQWALRAQLSEKEDKEVPREEPQQPLSLCLHQPHPLDPPNGSHLQDPTVPSVEAWREIGRTLPLP